MNVFDLNVKEKLASPVPRRLGYNLIVKTIVRNTLDRLKCEKNGIVKTKFSGYNVIVICHSVFVSLDIIPFLKIIISNRRANINAVTEESRVAVGVREA